MSIEFLDTNGKNWLLRRKSISPHHHGESEPACVWPQVLPHISSRTCFPHKSPTIFPTLKICFPKATLPQEVMLEAIAMLVLPGASVLRLQLCFGHGKILPFDAFKPLSYRRSHSAPGGSHTLQSPGTCNAPGHWSHRSQYFLQSPEALCTSTSQPSAATLSLSCQYLGSLGRRLDSILCLYRSQVVFTRPQEP